MQLISERKNLSYDVYQYIRDKIISAQWPPGKKITEEALTRELNISRTPIREAFNQLARDMVVELVPRKGCYVRSVTRQEIMDIFQIRKALEETAIRAIIADQRGQSFNELYTAALLLDKNYDTTRETMVKAGTLDVEMHHRIGKESGNQVLAGMLNNLHLRIGFFIEKCDNKIIFNKQTWEEIKALLEALVRNDLEQAVKISDLHQDNLAGYVLSYSQVLA